MWKKVHKILGKRIKSHAPVLKINGKLIYNPNEVVTCLAEHLSNISKGSAINSFHIIKEKEEKIPINFETDQYYSYNDCFIMDELLSALSTCSNTAPGEDMITFEMLKHLHPNSLQYLLKLYNKIWVETYFPQD